MQVSIYLSKYLAPGPARPCPARFHQYSITHTMPCGPCNASHAMPCHTAATWTVEGCTQHRLSQSLTLALWPGSGYKSGGTQWLEWATYRQANSWFIGYLSRLGG